MTASASQPKPNGSMRPEVDNTPHTVFFPWGNEDDTSRANWPNSGDPFEIGPYPWTTPVGFYSGEVHTKRDFYWPGAQKEYQTSDGANGYGLYDMTGNVVGVGERLVQPRLLCHKPGKKPNGPETGTTDARWQAIPGSPRRQLVQWRVGPRPCGQTETRPTTEVLTTRTIAGTTLGFV